MKAGFYFYIALCCPRRKHWDGNYEREETDDDKQEPG